MLTLRPIIILAFICTAAALACKASTPPPAEVSDARRAGAQAAAEAALLTIDDLPDGWEVAPPDDEEDPKLAFEGECAKYNYLEDEMPGMIAEAESPEFTRPRNDSVEATVTVFEDAEAAREAFDIFRNFLDECKDEFISVLRDETVKTLEAEGADPEYIDAVAQMDVSLDEVPIPPLGDDSWGLRMMFHFDVGGLAFSLQVEVLTVVTDGMIADVSYTSLGSREPDRQELERLARIMLERMESASASLPD